MFHTISCPACKQPLQIEINGLIRGDKFECMHCGAVLSLSSNSSELLKKTMDTLEHIKQEALSANH
jgi:transposase-like protein